MRWHAVGGCGLVAGAHLFVVSQAAGGAFVVVLDAADGSRRAREHWQDR